MEKGRVIASFGRAMQVEDEAGTVIDCTIFGRRLELVCADRVRFQRESTTRGIVHEVEARRSLVTRTNSRGEPELVAANATQLAVVLAHPPLPDFYLVDRYLAAAEVSGLAAIIVLNKVDLSSWRGEECRDEIADWQRIGYRTVETSAVSGEGLADLATALADKVTLLVGQSGVGKSSLLNALAPDAAARTRAVVAKTGRGSHTTTHTALYRLQSGGELLDSPGVRDFAPGPDILRRAADGFREIVAAAAGCRFADCRHHEEPGCAVHAAVESSAIAARRYRSYVQLEELLGRLAKKRRGY